MHALPVEERVDVLVVGAGPTGLMLANWLQRSGVDALTVDSKQGPTRESRALVVQARTMEIYDQLGVADAVAAEAFAARRVSPGFESHSFGSVPVGQLGTGLTPFPGLFVLEQSRTERILGENLNALGGSVHWSTALEDLVDDPSGGCIATVTGPDGTRRILARYVVGADGGSSAVRRLRRIPFTGVTNEHTFYVADAHDVAGVEEDAVTLRFGTDAFLLAFPMASGSHFRLLGTVRLSDHVTEVSERSARAKMREVFGVEYGATTWFATYRVHHRVADRFRDGAVFLAGDAGHVHSPVGAQGMNTGLQDAHNLALKFADVLAGRANAEYLDRYDAERRPVAQRLVSTTDRAFGLVTSGTGTMQLARRVLARLLVPLLVRGIPRLPLAPRLFGYLSQIRIHYWMSDASREEGRGRRGPVVGRRLPWTGENLSALRSTRWQVHVYGPFDARAAVRFTRQLPVEFHAFATPGRTRLRPGRYYLVRPDGFVCAVADPAQAASYFRSELMAWGVDPDALESP
ncbi:2-polyprenyl-6-methoxyphenol hydroxylase-like FAD-dependent oxidoreductase [Okibacterium sp. HSC-33S16]|uniref:FAD-dependent monooxygenase n=1 Tax=Okibacterium sp. HSC-33S16 TaxID=2910965 RepID=UPI00209CAB2F|nr:FAD-dependent monooxygenase [Okibacterium sp. HSC-33S16]MCP2030314.1 2-polyprenyl-6-methoxyphenol hydroxylase-like FAD-dependent oxidoreductase [Okibacterium sp. HSC-33S16]